MQYLGVSFVKAVVSHKGSIVDAQSVKSCK